MAERKKSQDQSAKKWKGKDWFTIYAPSMFKGIAIAETPCLDPASLIGRDLSANVSQITGQASKYYMLVDFKVDGVEGSNASTRFNGYGCSRDYMLHVVRKRTSKVRHIVKLETKDKWKLQATALLILNRRTDREVRGKMRDLIEGRLISAAKERDIDGFIKDVIAGTLQKEMKQTGNKIYPVRFSEIERIKVLKVPDK